MVCPSDFSLPLSLYLLSRFWKDEFSVSVDCNIRATSASFVFNEVDVALVDSTKVDEIAGLGVIIKSLMNLHFNEVLSSPGAE